MRSGARSRARWACVGVLAFLVAFAGSSASAARDETLTVGGGSLHVVLNGQAGNDDVVVRWVRRSADAVAGYFGHFPVPAVELRIATIPGRRVRHGVTFGGRRPTIRVSVGESATSADLDDDWVLVHELSHLAFPDLTSDDSWAEEGLSTYVEPWARVRAGILDERKAWAGVMEGMPQAHLGRGRGLHGTREWGPTYWGGALFWLTADVLIHERSQGRLGLRDALRGILEKGGDIRAHWPLLRALAAGDEAIGMNVLTELYRRLGEAPGTVDLPDLWRRLGIQKTADGVVYDNKAQHATFRRSIDGSSRAGG